MASKHRAFQTPKKWENTPPPSSQLPSKVQAGETVFKATAMAMAKAIAKNHFIFAEFRRCRPCNESRRIAAAGAQNQKWPVDLKTGGKWMEKMVLKTVVMKLPQANFLGKTYGPHMFPTSSVRRRRKHSIQCANQGTRSWSNPPVVKNRAMKVPNFSPLRDGSQAPGWHQVGSRGGGSYNKLVESWLTL